MKMQCEPIKHNHNGLVLLLVNVPDTVICHSRTNTNTVNLELLYKMKKYGKFLSILQFTYSVVFFISFGL